MVWLILKIKKLDCYPAQSKIFCTQKCNGCRRSSQENCIDFRQIEFFDKFEPIREHKSFIFWFDIWYLSRHCAIERGHDTSSECKTGARTLVALNSWKTVLTRSESETIHIRRGGTAARLQKRLPAVQQKLHCHRALNYAESKVRGDR